MPSSSSSPSPSSWSPSLFKSLRSTDLENTGSTARDHCANERTMLSWLRTSLTLTSFGIALAQFFRLPSGSTGTDPESIHAHGHGHRGETASLLSSSSIFYGRDMAKPLGCSFVVLGILTLLFGAKRYFAVQEQLIRGRFETSRSEAFILIVLVAALLIAVLSVIIAAPAS